MMIHVIRTSAQPFDVWLVGFHLSISHLFVRIYDERRIHFDDVHSGKALSITKCCNSMYDVKQSLPRRIVSMALQYNSSALLNVYIQFIHPNVNISYHANMKLLNRKFLSLFFFTLCVITFVAIDMNVGGQFKQWETMSRACIINNGQSAPKMAMQRVISINCIWFFVSKSFILVGWLVCVLCFNFLEVTS